MAEDGLKYGAGAEIIGAGVEITGPATGTETGYGTGLG